MEGKRKKGKPVDRDKIREEMYGNIAAVPRQNGIVQTFNGTTLFLKKEV